MTTIRTFLPLSEFAFRTSFVDNILYDKQLTVFAALFQRRIVKELLGMKVSLMHFLFCLKLLIILILSSLLIYMLSKMIKSENFSCFPC